MTLRRTPTPKRLLGVDVSGCQVYTRGGLGCTPKRPLGVRLQVDYTYTYEAIRCIPINGLRCTPVKASQMDGHGFCPAGVGVLPCTGV